MTFVDRRFMGWSNGVGYGGQAAIVRIVDEVAVISVTSGVAARLEVVDPAFIRSRRGVRAVCATRAGVGDDGGGNVRVRRRCGSRCLPRAPPSRARCWPLIRNTRTVFAHSAAVDGLSSRGRRDGRAQPDRGVGRSGTACPADVFVVRAGPPPFSIHPTRGTK